MMWSLPSLAAYGLFTSSVLAASNFQPCPPLGPFFPVPPAEVIATSPLLKKAAKNLDAVFDKTSTGGGSHGGLDPSISFSVALFTASNANDDAAPFFHEYHYTNPALKKNGTGVHEIDSNSVYRLGDSSKLFTVWTVLTEVGDKIWNEPVVKFVPELARMARRFSEAQDAVDEVNWQEVTVGELASHLAGIGRDCTLLLLPLNSSKTDQGGRHNRCLEPQSGLCCHGLS
jgi:CubicO group peptidase (beta-lactamase class C family)